MLCPGEQIREQDTSVRLRGLVFPCAGEGEVLSTLLYKGHMEQLGLLQCTMECFWLQSFSTWGSVIWKCLVPGTRRLGSYDICKMVCEAFVSLRKYEVQHTQSMLFYFSFISLRTATPLQVTCLLQTPSPSTICITRAQGMCSM